MSATSAEVRFEIRRVPWGASSTEFVYKLVVICPDEGETIIDVDLTPPSPTPSLVDAQQFVASKIGYILFRA